MLSLYMNRLYMNRLYKRTKFTFLHSILLAAMIAVAASPVSAHGAESVTASESLREGFLHPVLGFDHFLAMICVGIVSTRYGKSGIWVVPATFVLALINGAVAGFSGYVVLGVEYLIAASLAVFAAAIFASKQLPLKILVLGVIAAGLVHGNAHGLEIPHAASPVFFALGFSIASALMHLVGIGVSELGAFGRMKIPQIAGVLCIVFAVLQTSLPI